MAKAGKTVPEPRKVEMLAQTNASTNSKKKRGGQASRQKRKYDKMRADLGIEPSFTVRIESAPTPPTPGGAESEPPTKFTVCIPSTASASTTVTRHPSRDVKLTCGKSHVSKRKPACRTEKTCVKPNVQVTNHEGSSVSLSITHSQQQPAQTEPVPLQMIDSHCHWDRCLSQQKYGCLGSSVPEVEEAIFSEGSMTKPKRTVLMQAMVSVFCDPSSWAQIDEILASDKRLVYTIGYHPQHLKKYHLKPEEIREMERHLQRNSCVGIGEIGLDYHHAQSPKQREIQRRNLMSIFRFIQISRTRKPIVLHLRNSDDPDDSDDVFPHALRLLRENHLDSHKIHLHCFSGTKSDAEVWYNTCPNLKFGFTCTLLYRGTRESLHEVVKWLPASSLLAESDAPYLKPPNMPGPNHPWNVHQVLDEMASAKLLPLPRLYDQVLRNTKQLYNIQ